MADLPCARSVIDRIELDHADVALALLQGTANRRRRLARRLPFFVAFWDVLHGLNGRVEIVAIPVEYEVVMECAGPNVVPLPRRLGWGAAPIQLRSSDRALRRL